MRADVEPPSAGQGVRPLTGERLLLRTHPAAGGPRLIYLPGLHGDWTLVGPLRAALSCRATFVEITYPRTVEWSLPDYARAVATALSAEGIQSGWLLAESFGSQVAWAMVADPTSSFRLEGLVLAGGFVRYTPRWLVRGGEQVLRSISIRTLQRQVRIYLRIVRWLRYRHAANPEDLKEFARRRTELDQAAAAHRLRLITTADWRPVAAATPLPVFHLSGLLDPVVCWWPVRRWLRRNCPGFRASRLIAASDHNVLNSQPARVADQILGWIGNTIPHG